MKKLLLKEFKDLVYEKINWSLYRDPFSEVYGIVMNYELWKHIMIEARENEDYEFTANPNGGTFDGFKLIRSVDIELNEIFIIRQNKNKIK